MRFPQQRREAAVRDLVRREEQRGAGEMFTLVRFFAEPPLGIRMMERAFLR